MRINGVTYGKLKTPLKVNGNLKYCWLNETTKAIGLSWRRVNARNISFTPNFTSKNIPYQPVIKTTLKRTLLCREIMLVLFGKRFSIAIQDSMYVSNDTCITQIFWCYNLICCCFHLCKNCTNTLFYDLPWQNVAGRLPYEGLFSPWKKERKI